jgi:hypothetical protein
MGLHLLHLPPRDIGRQDQRDGITAVNPLEFQFDAGSHHRLVFPQSSSASRFTAGAAGFLNLSQSRERPET